MPASWDTWTEEEIAVVRKYTKEGVKNWAAACKAELPRRTVSAIRGLAQKQGWHVRQFSSPRLREGDIVGNFTIISPGQRQPGSGGWQYWARDERCGHERLVRDSAGHLFEGIKGYCGCPVRRYNDEGYVQWQWRLNGKKVNIGEHRIVMERELGRELYPDENVHHKNGVRDDNQPENLELWNTSQPAGQRPEDKVAWARKILALYSDL